MMDSEIPDTGLERPTEPGLLVEPQAGAVVSRTVLKQPSGSVTLFAFDAGEGLSEHTTSHQALIYGLDGEAEIMIAAIPHVVGSGQALHLPANVPHAVKALSSFKMMLVMLRRPES
jgi:quercetin dioxygenase-like cupin family protein